MKTRHLLFAPLIAALALLTACGDDSSAGDDAHTKAYLKVVNGVGAGFESDDAAVAAGKKACSDLESGKSMSEVTNDLKAEAGNVASAAAVVGAAISSFCPDQKDKMVPDMPTMPSMPKLSDLPDLPSLPTN